MNDRARRQPRKPANSTPPRVPTTVRTDGKSDRLLRVEQVAERLGVSVRTVWSLRSCGKLPDAVKIANATRWRRSEIEIYIRSLSAASR